MGISFKVSKSGKRFRPKPPPPSVALFPVEGEKSDDVIAGTSKKGDSISFSSRNLAGEASDSKNTAEISENEVSFCLNLFPDGYSVTKPMESASGHETSVDVPTFLHPYDRASETMFSAIESGMLPRDILNDIPCKYVNGTLVCQVRDHRKCSSEEKIVSVNSSPIITRVRLRMSLENIVKDIPTISDSEWTYGDLMEVESRILKALEPQLSLDPTSQLDKQPDNPRLNKFNFQLRRMRRKRLMQIPEVAVTSNNLHSKKVCLERAEENSRLENPGSLSHQTTHENSNIQNPNTMLLRRNANSLGHDGFLLTPPMVLQPSNYPIGLSSPRMMEDQRLSSPGRHDVMIPFADNNDSSVHGKRKNQDGQLSPLMSKKARTERNLQHLGPQLDWKNTLMRQQQQQSIGGGIHPYANNGMQKFSQQEFEGVMIQEGGSTPLTIGQQQGIKYNLKEEPVETERLDRQDSELTGINPWLQNRMSAQFMRSSFPQGQWNNLGQALDISSNLRKEDTYQKRILVQSPRVSAGGLPQSPLSSRSGEYSSGSHQFGAMVNSGHVSQNEKSVVTSIPAVGSNDPMQRQNKVQAAAKRRSNSFPKTPAGVGSQASMSTLNAPISASTPPVGSQGLGDQSMHERFSMIGMVAKRFQLNCKKKKVDACPMRKPNAYSAHNLMLHLSSDVTDVISKDETYKLSKSVVAGSMKSRKTRFLNFVRTEHFPGNSFQLVTKARMRMIMSEKPNDGNVAFHIGEVDDAEYLTAEEHLPTLPNAHIADLLAAQFISLMTREGYDVEDHLQPRDVSIKPTSETQQFSEGRPSQSLPNDAARSGSSTGNPLLNSPQNMPAQKMLLQMSQGLQPGVSIPSRPQQLPPQQSQFQRVSMTFLASSMQHLDHISQNTTSINQLNKHSSLQPQLLQQQQQRRMMSVGMANINMVGLGGLSGMMGGGSRMPSGVGPAVNLSSATNITNAIRNGTLTPEQAMLMKLRLQQSGAGMGVLGGGGAASASQMQPVGSSGLSMLGPVLGQAGLGQMQQRMAIGHMGPPKLMPGDVNPYMNKQQQQMRLLQQQQMQLQQQQQQQQQH